MTADDRLMSLLHEGSDNPTSQSELTALMGLQDTRTLRRLVEKARRNGCLILSCQRGYYKAACDEEIRQFVSSMTKRIATTAAVTRAARRYLRDRRQVDGQMSIFEWLEHHGGEK